MQFCKTTNLSLYYYLIKTVNVSKMLFVREFDFFLSLSPNSSKTWSFEMTADASFNPKALLFDGLGLRLKKHLFIQMAPFWKVWISSPKQQRARFWWTVFNLQRMSYTLASLVPDAHWPLDGTISTSWLYRSWEEVKYLSSVEEKKCVK